MRKGKFSFRFNNREVRVSANLETDARLYRRGIAEPDKAHRSGVLGSQEKCILVG